MINVDDQTYNFENLQECWNFFLINQEKNNKNLIYLNKLNFIDFAQIVKRKIATDKQLNILLQNINTTTTKIKDSKNAIQKSRKEMNLIFIKTIIIAILEEKEIELSTKILISQIIKKMQINLSAFIKELVEDIEIKKIINLKEQQKRLKQKTLLHLAVENNNLEITKLLIVNGADPNIKNAKNSNPLECSINFYSDLEITKLLIDHGADINHINKDGDTALDFAIRPIYNEIPHLIMPVINEANKVPAALQTVILEMMRRYQLLAKNGSRNIDSYNKKMTAEVEKLPYLLIIIDELADLMVQASKEMEEGIMRITQMGRAAGIHLIIATQRPSIDIITGVIKNNIPSRIAFKVASWIDSKTILNTAGAEKLLGKGDMLFLVPGQTNISRLQSPWISDEDITAVINFIKNQATANYDHNFIEKMTTIKNNKK